MSYPRKKRWRHGLPVDVVRQWRRHADLALGILMALALVVGMVLIALDR